MEKDQAIIIAQEHIDKLNQENTYSSKMFWILTEPILVSFGFFFNYRYELKNPYDQFAIGGSPGFVVDNETGEINSLSWEEYRKLNL